MSTKFHRIGALSALTSLAGLLLFASSAQAFSLTGENTLSIGGRAKFNTSTGYLDFAGLDKNGKPTFEPSDGTKTGIAVVTPASTGRFGSLAFSRVTLKDLTLDKALDTDLWSYNGDPVSAFLSVNSSTVSFQLSKFDLTRDSNGSWIASVAGIFEDTELPGTGQFDPNEDNLFASSANGASYSFDIEEVPTPALLPGLLGMGVTALRKRRSEEENAAA
ncbi:hypothetical protein C7271_09385 [filamentous cyanobacterium CCP5]|nr:hypothetical protein C7271_09385 [filamentous cyanobacterium CCP5]